MLIKLSVQQQTCFLTERDTRFTCYRLTFIILLLVCLRKNNLSFIQNLWFCFFLIFSLSWKWERSQNRKGWGVWGSWFQVGQIRAKQETLRIWLSLYLDKSILPPFTIPFFVAKNTQLCPNWVLLWQNKNTKNKTI